MPRWLAVGSLVILGSLGGSAQAPESRLRLVPQASDSLIADMEESVDGTRLITHDRRFAPRLWDAKTLRLLRVLGGARDPIPVVGFNPDGTQVLTLGREEMRTWSARLAKPLARFEAAEGEFFVEGKFSPDGKRVAITTSSGSVHVVESSTGKGLQTLKGLSAFVPTVDWSADGKRLAAGSGTKTLIWELSSGKSVALSDPKIARVRTVDLNSAGTLAAVTDVDRGATVFESGSGKALYSVDHVVGERTEELRAMVGAQFVLPDESAVLTFDGAGDVILVDASTGKELKRLKGHAAPIDEIRLNRDRTRAGTHGDDEKVILWDLVAGKSTPFALKPGDMPTAATFGADSNQWYLGLANGELRKYDVASGNVASGTFGGTTTIARIRFLAEKRLLTISKNATGSIFLENLAESKHLVVRSAQQNSDLYQLALELVSDSGRFNLADRQGNIFAPPIQFVGFDLWTGKSQFSSVSQLGDRAEFVPGTDLAMMTFSDGNVFCWDFRNAKELYSVTFPNPMKRFTGAISPDASLGVHGPFGATRDYAVWKLESRDIVCGLQDAGAMDLQALRFSSDGKQIAGCGPKQVAVWNADDGKLVFRAPIDFDFTPDQVAFSRDGKSVLAFGFEGWAVVPIGSPTQIRGQANGALRMDMDQQTSADAKRLLTWGRNKAYVMDVESGKELHTLTLNDTVVSAIFSPNDQRILTVDLTDGITIWDAAKMQRLGNLVQMRDGSWLVMDPSGRYDATDPDSVSGAMYVLEWDGGLEPLEMGQFKGLFWDPGLLQKLLGTNKEPLRIVPQLDNLKLYPTVRMTPNANGSLSVALSERDGGGIGLARISVNGKEIARRSGSGVFTIPADLIRPHLLPETRLPKGQGNVISVRVSNQAGTLTSLPTHVDIGIPAGLKAPEVNLYALFVGVGDYVGQSRDLAAPPSDASRLAFAISNAGKGLLQDRVKITLLTTEDKATERQPSRANILKWFEETAQNATSSDIAVVFFAGHGMDKIGSKSGYFFLTMEANPDALSEANIGAVSLSGEDLRERLKSIAANKQVVILDTCHSGAAAGNLIDGEERSVSGDYQRAWDAIKEATGTWMLAGAAANQLSYESTNVDHGMLTYALLEAVDQASSDGLRPGQDGTLFLDVERWLSYAANRVESLKNEVGLTGIQRPEFKRSTSAGSFDLGVINAKDRGLIGLKPPKPIVILGPFELDQEDPEGLEESVRAAFSESSRLKAWFDVAKHPNVYRVAGEYTVEGNSINVKVFLQRFDPTQKRSTLETFMVSAPKGKPAQLAAQVLNEIEKRIAAREAAQSPPTKS